MSDLSKDICEIKESLGRIDERTKGLPEIINSFTEKHSSTEAKLKFHFWLITSLIVAIGAVSSELHFNH